jgi:hypothetical protein
MADSFYEQALSNGRQSRSLLSGVEGPKQKTPRPRARNQQDIPPVTTEEILSMMRGLVDFAGRRVSDQATHCPNCGRSPTNTQPY